MKKKKVLRTTPIKVHLEGGIDGNRIIPLHPGHDDEVARLKARIAELEEERRWRKFTDEKPEHHQWIEACYCEDRIKEHLPRIEVRRWDDGMKYDVFNQELYIGWRPLPIAPEE